MQPPDLLARVASDLVAHLGEDADYLSRGAEAAITVRVVPGIPRAGKDDDYALTTVTVRVLVSDIPAPAQGDALTLAAGAFRVMGVTRESALWWRLECVTDARARF